MGEIGGKLETHDVMKNDEVIECNKEAIKGYKEMFVDDINAGIVDPECVGGKKGKIPIDPLIVYADLFDDDYENESMIKTIDMCSDAELEVNDIVYQAEEEFSSERDNLNSCVELQDDLVWEEKKCPEYNEDGTRELTNEEKEELKNKLGWSDKKINENCRIDENGVIHYKTRCQEKEGQDSECGVGYERKTFEYKGAKIEGVFPAFDSAFDTCLKEEDYQSSSVKQLSECNKQLKKVIESDPEQKKQFTDEQLEDIENERTPRGYTWHHAEEPGKMQLVITEEHDSRLGGAAHTGGNSIWGNKSIEKDENSGKKGEHF